ncbi:hypothetical protein IVB45_02185 [Bradyrhizobium sp. 4]|uniref:hypothetical protein n=1 Tax=Bradyrhizobium sp. 4 TaxID=2782678 RepID=UPI001FFF8B4A|nr:hypothetical protein [Bradyrhizobium sp. 4]UPJ35843.1 hypothetical protein IVB45_02185 [Bradyrhizobium sp. 4]
MNLLLALIDWLDDFIINVFHDPLAQHPSELPMNTEPVQPIQPHIELKQPLPATQKPTTAELLYQAAFNAIGKDASPGDKAPDERACAESVSNIIRKVMPGFPVILSTIALDKHLWMDARFKMVVTPVAGCVSVFPTKGGVIGHCGIWGKRGWVMSNNSATGKWEANYTDFGWREAAHKRGLEVFHYLPL